MIFMQHKKDWQQITDTMLALREQGYTNSEIGKKLHYCRSSVYSRIGKQPEGLALKKMLALREQGMSNKEIAALIGCHQRTVYKTIGKNTRSVPRGFPSRFKPDEMIALRNQGMSNREIAKINKCDVSTVDHLIGPMRHHYGPDFDKAIQDLRDHGWGCYRIGNKLGVPAETVRRHVKKMRTMKEGLNAR